MKFLRDAHLPASLAKLLVGLGHDAIHVSELPGGLTPTDAEITRDAGAEERVVASKDADFASTHLPSREPARLLAIRTGNTSNRDLLALVYERLAEIVTAFGHASHVELHRTLLVVRSPVDD